MHALQREISTKRSSVLAGLTRLHRSFGKNIATAVPCGVCAGVCVCVSVNVCQPVCAQRERERRFAVPETTRNCCFPYHSFFREKGRKGIAVANMAARLLLLGAFLVVLEVCNLPSFLFYVFVDLHSVRYVRSESDGNRKKWVECDMSTFR